MTLILPPPDPFWTLLFDVTLGLFVIIGLVLSVCGLVGWLYLKFLDWEDSNAHEPPQVPCATCGALAIQYDYGTPQCPACALEEWKRRERVQAFLPED
jgi:hypothetical protein